MSLILVPVSSAFGQSVMDDFRCVCIELTVLLGAIAHIGALIFNTKLGKGRTSCFNLPIDVGREK
jgi:hypothetical protein